MAVQSLTIFQQPPSADFSAKKGKYIHRPPHRQPRLTGSPAPFLLSSLFFLFCLPVSLVLLFCAQSDSVGNLNRLRKVGSSRPKAILGGMARIDGLKRFFSQQTESERTSAFFSSTLGSVRRSPTDTLLSCIDNCRDKPSVSSAIF